MADSFAVHGDLLQFGLGGKGESAFNSPLLCTVRINCTTIFRLQALPCLLSGVNGQMVDVAACSMALFDQIDELKILSCISSELAHLRFLLN